MGENRNDKLEFFTVFVIIPDCAVYILPGRYVLRGIALIILGQSHIFFVFVAGLVIIPGRIISPFYMQIAHCDAGVDLQRYRLTRGNTNLAVCNPFGIKTTVHLEVEVNIRFAAKVVGDPAVISVRCLDICQFETFRGFRVGLIGLIELILPLIVFLSLKAFRFDFQNNIAARLGRYLSLGLTRVALHPGVKTVVDINIKVYANFCSEPVFCTTHVIGILPNIIEGQFRIGLVCQRNLVYLAGNPLCPSIRHAFDIISRDTNLKGNRSSGRHCVSVFRDTIHVEMIVINRQADRACHVYKPEIVYRFYIEPAWNEAKLICLTSAKIIIILIIDLEVAGADG